MLTACRLACKPARIFAQSPSGETSMSDDEKPSGHGLTSGLAEVEEPPEADAQPAGAGTAKHRSLKRETRPHRRFRKAKPGAAPGIELHELPAASAATATARITCIDYSAERYEMQEVADLAGFIGQHRPAWSTVRWIDVDGLSDLGVVRALAEKYHLHPLAIEDVLHTPQRPRVQAYDEVADYQARLFIIVRMLELREGQLQSEQVSLFVGHHTVLTFQEAPGDVWDPLRQRIRTPGSRLRLADASFLAYSLIDAVVDQAFPILERFGDRLELLEDLVLQRPTREAIQEIHQLKRELLILRRAMWPTREVVNKLQREPHECFSSVTQTYLRDVYDHTVQIIDILETYREMATGLTETYMTAIGIRMNEVMKVLTVIGTIFIPLTFLAGVYGMNFQFFPELRWKWGYAMFWGISAALAAGMLAWFRRRGWL